MTDMDGGAGIAKEAETALDYLADRREFWSQQRPDYQGQVRRSVSSTREDKNIKNNKNNKKTLKYAVMRKQDLIRKEFGRSLTNINGIQ